jgi:hypothetical protein
MLPNPLPAHARFQGHPSGWTLGQHLATAVGGDGISALRGAWNLWPWFIRLISEHGVWPARRPDGSLLDLSVPTPVPLHANSASANAKSQLACRSIFLTCDTNHPGRRLRGPTVPGSVYITHVPASVGLIDRPGHRRPSHRLDTKRHILRSLLLAAVLHAASL